MQTSNNGNQIVVVGSHAPGIFVRVQRLPTAGETVIGWDLQEPEDGGKGSNQAIAAARLGMQVSFVGCLGVDRIGAEGERLMREAGVDLRFLHHSHTTGTGAGINILDENGVPAMVTCLGANEELNNEQVEQSLASLKNAKIMLTQFEIKPEVALHAAKIARDHGTLTIVNPAPATPVDLGELEVADVLIPNEVEAKMLLGMDPEGDFDLEELALRLLQETKTSIVVITAGDKGIAGADGAGVWQASPPEVSVVDTSGAGDVFCAAFATGLIKGMNHREASLFACSTASLSVSGAGTIPSFPTTKEAEEFYRFNNLTYR